MINLLFFLSIALMIFSGAGFLKRRRFIENNLKLNEQKLEKLQKALFRKTQEKNTLKRRLVNQQHHLKKHNETEDRLRFITQNAIDGIITINDSAQILSWNYGAQQLFGYTEEEIINKNLSLIIPHGRLVKEEINTKPMELQGKHKDGHIFPVEISHTHRQQQQMPFDTIIVRDITERKDNEKRLIRAMQQARSADASKSEFLAIISHELRTPLNAIIGFTECLLMKMDGPLNVKQHETVKKIEASSFSLLKLINTILDLAKIEAHRMELEVNCCDFTDLLFSCVEEMQVFAKQKQILMHVVTKKESILIEIDKMRIKQVLLNLLSNAIKFTEQGEIKIALSYHVDHIEVAIVDTGIGLSTSEMIKIFQPFSQADSSITRKYGGTGLGLVISKKIIELHGGQIYVKSKKGVGSTFGFQLPIKDPLNDKHQQNHSDR